MSAPSKVPRCAVEAAAKIGFCLQCQGFVVGDDIGTDRYGDHFHIIVGGSIEREPILDDNGEIVGYEEAVVPTPEPCGPVIIGGEPVAAIIAHRCCDPALLAYHIMHTFDTPGEIRIGVDHKSLTAAIGEYYDKEAE